MLAETQRRFRDTVMAETDAGLAAGLRDLFSGADEPLRRRLAAYRRNAFGNLCGALAASYPVIVRIVGEAFFREAARRYILIHPSGSGDLNDYGADFPEFLADYPHAVELPYLPDVARLEWEIQTLRRAADTVPADLSLLACVAPDRYGDLRLMPDPRSVRIDSAWPVVAIWHVNQPYFSGDMAVDFSQRQQVLARLAQGVPSAEALAPAAASFFDGLRAGLALADAAERALGVDPAFDFGTTLQQWIGRRLIHSVSLPE